MGLARSRSSSARGRLGLEHARAAARGGPSHRRSPDSARGDRRACARARCRTSAARRCGRRRRAVPELLRHVGAGRVGHRLVAVSAASPGSYGHSGRSSQVLRSGLGTGPAGSRRRGRARRAARMWLTTDALAFDVAQLGVGGAGRQAAVEEQPLQMPQQRAGHCGPPKQAAARAAELESALGRSAGASTRTRPSRLEVRFRHRRRPQRRAAPASEAPAARCRPPARRARPACGGQPARRLGQIDRSARPAGPSRVIVSSHSRTFCDVLARLEAGQRRSRLQLDHAAVDARSRAARRAGAGSRPPGAPGG